MVCFYNNVYIYAVLTLSSRSSVTFFLKEDFIIIFFLNPCYISPYIVENVSL